MMKLALSPAATSLMRGLLARTGVAADRIILIEARSTDWQSLTFIGERHEISLRIPPPDAQVVARALTEGLEEAEFAIPGQILADIALAEPPIALADGSLGLMIEALTIREEPA
ncbi:hypothetical protein [Sphingomicrobium nitratireducens]|uniref:hypothetical protein n=1 Tax=Sphingomicrobium nitratireducens TaxID=2964666 RepID=UPI002240D148|nr:hypothetical protein [Sphingomicrobium nitratireducens]